MMIFGVPQERVIFGIVCLFALAFTYDIFVVDHFETKKTSLPAQTAVEVVIGVFAVLVIYLYAVRDVVISGPDSFTVLFLFFAAAGIPMCLGSDRRSSSMNKVK